MPDPKLHKPQDADLSGIEQSQPVSNIGRGADIHFQHKNSARNQKPAKQEPQDQKIGGSEEQEREEQMKAERKAAKKIEEE